MSSVPHNIDLLKRWEVVLVMMSNNRGRRHLRFERKLQIKILSALSEEEMDHLEVEVDHPEAEAEATH